MTIEAWYGLAMLIVGGIAYVWTEQQMEIKYLRALVEEITSENEDHENQTS